MLLPKINTLNSGTHKLVWNKLEPKFNWCKLKFETKVSQTVIGFVHVDNVWSDATFYDTWGTEIATICDFDEAKNTKVDFAKCKPCVNYDPFISHLLSVTPILTQENQLKFISDLLWKADEIIFLRDQSIFV